MSISFFALSGILIAISSGVMAFVMFTFGRAALHRLWGIFCISVFVWGLGGFFIGTAADPASADWWWRITHIGVAFIPTLFLHFVYHFLEIKRPRELALFYGISTAFAVLAVSTNLLIAHMRFVFGEFFYDSPPGLLYPLFTAYFFGLTIYSHYLLFRGYSRTSGDPKRDQIRRARILYFFLGMAFSFAGGGLSFLPVYGVDVYPIANFAVIAYPIIIGYAILRLRLFDIRVATAQGLMLLLWTFAGIRMVVSLSREEFFLNAALFVAVVILGVFVIRSVSKEIAAREKIEELARNLEKANEGLKKLDQLKTDFLSFASHQLRSPLSAIKGYISMMLEGTYGEVHDAARQALDRAYQSNEKLIRLVDDFLNLARIEEGRIQYRFDSASVEDMVDDIVRANEESARRRGLELRWTRPVPPLPSVRMDAGKIHEVIYNLIDNAIKYTEHGWVAVSAEQVPFGIRVSVQDTGIGLSSGEREKLFTRFGRAGGSRNANAGGVGIGLYIAKTIVDAHGGRIGAESAGEYTGSTFWIELPFAPKEKNVSP